MGQIWIGFLEFFDLLGIEDMDLPLEPAQAAILPEGIHKVVPVDRGGFRPITTSLSRMELSADTILSDNIFSTAKIVLHRKATVLASIRLHQVGDIAPAAHINANE